MHFLEGFRLALQQIVAHKLKSVFSLIGVIIGIMFLIAVITVVEGMNRYVREDFAGSIFGINTFTVVRRTQVTTGAESQERRRREARNPYLKKHDVEVVKAAVPDAMYIAWNAGRSFPEVWAGERRRRNILVIGGSDDYAAAKGWDVEVGRAPSPVEQKQAVRVAVIGPQIMDKLFPDGSAVGKRIRLGAYRYEVIGVFERRGGFIGDIWDSAVLIPFNTYLETLALNADEVDEIDVKMHTTEEMEAAMFAVEGALRSDRELRPGEENNFHLQTSSEILNVWEKINNVLMAALPGLVSIALIVGGIVIMNIMLLSVTNRTREIGVRKALGARQRDILIQFLAEASTLTLVGSFIGMGLGIALAKVVSAVTPLPAAVAPWVLALSVVLGLSVGLASGVYPAYRAARLNPIEALRYE
jgi:putative ABC transport system permease protein